ncbi:MAG: hypothetical protein J6B09_00550 [Clostridia bacterium]|nr:hypothetical protein [Clostridia bacterium]
MKRFLVLFILTLGSILLLSLGVSAEARQAVFYNGSSVVARIPLDRGESLTLPEGPDMGAKKFVGWVLSDNDTERLYAAGDRIDIGGDLAFHALGVEIKTLTGAAVSDTSQTKLRFDGAVALADYNRLVALLGADQVKCGVLIAPYMATNAAEFDHSSTVEGLLDRPADSFLYSTDSLGVFGGRTDEIGGEALLEKYCGRAYLSVTVGGKTHTVYADYSLEDHVRNAHGVTACAFEDRASNATAAYANVTADGCYSPYTAEQLNALRARLDQVIYVSIMGSGEVLGKYSKDHFTFYDFNNAHYVSPYRVDRVIEDEGYEIYVVVGKDGADFNTVTAYYIGGSYTPPNRAEEWKADGIYIKNRN